jgi:hypothetical protein
MNQNVQFSDVIRARSEYNDKCKTIFNMKYEQEWAYLENVINTSVINFLQTASPENEGMMRWFSYERSRTPNLFRDRYLCKDYYEGLKNNGFVLKFVSHESMKNVIQIETRVSSSFPDREIIITVHY